MDLTIGQENILFTNWVTRSVQGNTKLDLSVRPELARVVHEGEGCEFPSTDRVIRLVNYCTTLPFLKGFDKHELSSNVHINDCQECFNIYKSSIRLRSVRK